MTPLQTWLLRQTNAGVLRYDGQRNGIDYYQALSHPWMEEEMNATDPTRPCGCEPVPTKPCCDGGDDEED